MIHNVLPHLGMGHHSIPSSPFLPCSHGPSHASLLAAPWTENTRHPASSGSLTLLFSPLEHHALMSAHVRHFEKHISWSLSPNCPLAFFRYLQIIYFYSYFPLMDCKFHENRICFIHCHVRFRNVLSTN